jgi:CheY-like chemotaxis protein
MGERTQRVLIVDDDSTVRHILATALRQRSLNIDEATNGGEAIGMLREHTYAAILLDLMLPHVDGFGVLDAIGTDLPSPPVVLVVTGASRELIEKLDTTRIHGVVRKPFDPVEVANIVAAVAEVRSRSSFDTMALATFMSGGALINWLRQL